LTATIARAITTSATVGLIAASAIGAGLGATAASASIPPGGGGSNLKACDKYPYFYELEVHAKTSPSTRAGGTTSCAQVPTSSRSPAAPMG
jgi:hypothetical protein